MTNQRTVRVIVAGINTWGDSDLFFVRVAVPDDFDPEDENEIRHRVTAMRHARREGWEPVLTYDDLDSVFSVLCGCGVWDTFSTVPLEKTDDDDLCELLGFAALAAMDLLVGLEETDKREQIVSKSLRWLADDQTERDNS